MIEVSIFISLHSQEGASLSHLHLPFNSSAP